MTKNALPKALLTARALMAAGHYKQACSIYEELTSLENAEALCDLAFLNDTGRGLPRNPLRACSLYERAVVCGHPRAYITLFYSSPRAKEHLSRLMQPRLSQIIEQAEQGNAQAQFLVGMCCRNGLGRPKIYEDAYAMFRSSAEHGFAKSCVFLGLCLNFGAGCHRDDNEAYQWYTKAWEQGDTDALQLLAGCYLYGCGVPLDTECALELLNEGIHRKLPNTYYTMACHLLNQGHNSDLDRAWQLITMAAEGGHEIAARWIVPQTTQS
ncbi:hypothetical protein CXU13_01350 [Akkermansia muciniphila]|nr:hypothetical protein CXU12_12930 [Akkermansia muciniphila]PNC61280.1 hypothetical protein CXU13_01350 [Akkermansia muciniphila]